MGTCNQYLLYAQMTVLSARVEALSCTVPRVPECLSHRPNWLPPASTCECVPLLDTKGGGGGGGASSDDWRESLALCLVYECMYIKHWSNFAPHKTVISCPSPLKGLSSETEVDETLCYCVYLRRAKLKMLSAFSLNSREGCNLAGVLLARSETTIWNKKN